VNRETGVVVNRFCDELPPTRAYAAPLEKNETQTLRRFVSIGEKPNPSTTPSE
jgi:hypothetical protein